MSAEKYTGGYAAVLTAAGAILLLLSSAVAVPAQAPATWHAAPAYVPLFTPAVPGGAYSAYTSPFPLDVVLKALLAEPATLHPPGAWLPQATIALDAFGRNGTYNPWTVARLYGAQRARVARGPRQHPDGRAESWTLISPFPDPGMRRLDPGTLLLVVRVP